jgi:hypothetical protein
MGVMVHILPGSARKPGAALLFAALLLACGTPPPPPGSSGTSINLCLFPQACYLVDCPCQGAASCRIYPGVDLLQSGDLLGEGATGPLYPLPTHTDPGVICINPQDGGAAWQCESPEQVCPPQGPACDGVCVRSGQSCTPDGGTDGGAVPAGRCPFADDICCSVASDGGLDAGVPDIDGGIPDGGKG